jgi:murein DD-endopeptidase MepM/ murein hydrolase activator NlpD
MISFGLNVLPLPLADNMHTSPATGIRWFSFLLLLAVFPAARAQKVTWLPLNLQSGSPVLFSIDLDQPATEVHGTWLHQPVIFAKAEHGNLWYALAGIDVEQEPGTYPLELTVDGRSQTTQVSIKAASYRTTTLQVQEKFVSPDAASLQQIAADKAAKDAAYAHQESEPLWSGSFHSPVPFSPTDSFGTRRMFNGKLASIHRGTDFHAPPGTPVTAANDGVVLIAQPMFYEGNLVVIDHGQHFSTLYMHLSKIQVKAGERVKKGQRLGLSGATGRVTGPHLHFAARWHDMYVDAAMLLRMTLPPR